MYWSEDNKLKNNTSSSSVIDISIHLTCKQIPSDHIYALSEALISILPWLPENPQISIQQIYLPASGNGWQRESQSIDHIVHLSKRTRLKIRLPKSYINKIQHLSGNEISVSGFSIKFGAIKQHTLKATEILVSRFVYIPDCEKDEDKFLNAAFEQLKQKDIIVKKMLCGKSTALNFDGKTILTRSLMLADLRTDDSLTIQETGIGDYYLYGCGLFIPQKGIKAVNTEK